MWVDLRSLWEDAGVTQLSGSAQPISSASANLIATAGLTGSSITLTSAFANPSATADLAGTNAAGAYVTASMGTVPLSVSGVSMAGSYAAASLTATANLTGASISWAQPIAALSASAGLAGASISLSASLANLSATAGLNAYTVSGAYPIALLDVQSAGSITGISVTWSLATAALSFTGTPIPDVQTIVGAGRHRRRRRLFVEIDGRDFEVESVQHAQALLDQAKALARQVAMQKAEERLTVHLAKNPRVRPKIERPHIVTHNPELHLVVAQARQVISNVYKAAYRDAEIALRLAAQMRDDDADEEDLLLML